MISIAKCECLPVLLMILPSNICFVSDLVAVVVVPVTVAALAETAEVLAGELVRMLW